MGIKDAAHRYNTIHKYKYKYKYTNTKIQIHKSDDIKSNFYRLIKDAAQRWVSFQPPNYAQWDTIQIVRHDTKLNNFC